MHENLFKKYDGITIEQWEEEIHKVNFDKCDPWVFLAMWELLVKGDIEVPKKED